MVTASGAAAQLFHEGANKIWCLTIQNMTKGCGRLLIKPSLANEMISVLSKHSITATSFNTNRSNQTNDITLNLKRQMGKAQSECKWEAPFLTMRKEHTGTFNKKIKTSLIYFWPSFNHRVKNTTLMFLFIHKIQASKLKELLLMNPAWPSQQPAEIIRSWRGRGVWRRWCRETDKPH